MKRLVLIVLPFVAAACSLLAPKPDRTRSYVLNEVTPASNAGLSDVSLAVGPIELPSYLDRAEMVTRIPPNKIDISPLDRWAEPLFENFTRVFSADLATAVGTDQVTRFPWYGKQKIDYRVAVEVEEFERRDDGVAVLSARWKIVRPTDQAVVGAARSSFQVPIEGGATTDAVEALSEATALLAREIAATIARSRSPTPDSR